MSCPKQKSCWRCSYTKYLQQNKKYEITEGKEVPPARSDLFFQGFASAEMAATKTAANGKIHFGGLYAEIMPTPADKKTWCPDVEGGNYLDCHEYKKSQVLAQKAEQKRNQYPNAKNRVWISEEVKRRVSARDKYTCYYCLKNSSELRAQGVRCQIDHIVPLALGGTNEEINLCFSCSKCNREKGTQVWAKGSRKSAR